MKRMGAWFPLSFCALVMTLVPVHAALNTDSPIAFFTDAGNRLLRLNTETWLNEDRAAYSNSFGITDAFGITNIPVFVSHVSATTNGFMTNNFCGYTPAVHRLLQVVANIYDATTNRDLGASPAYPYFPSVFRPIFRRGTNTDENGIQLNDVYIVGYHEVVDASGALVQMQSANQVDLPDPVSRGRLPLVGTPYQGDASELMVWGIPVVIGAKKGFPNFNKFAMRSSVRATRKLVFHRPFGQPVNQTNQMYLFAVSNAFGIQAWNSYRDSYPRPLNLIAIGDVTLVVSNELGLVTGPGGTILTNRYFCAINTNISANAWPGFSISPASNISFVVPVLTNRLFLDERPYVQSSPGGGGAFSPSIVYDPPNTFRAPHLWLSIRSRVRYVVLDTSVSPNRIIDYVNLDGTAPPLDIVSIMLRDGGGCDGNLPIGGNPSPDCFWCTNRLGYPAGGGLDDPSVPTYGVLNQIAISENVPPPSDSFWRDYNSAGLPPNKLDEINTFLERLYDDGTTMTNLADLDFEAPFQPTRTFNHYVRWEANDPLVHYTISDLEDLFSPAQYLNWPTPGTPATLGQNDAITRLQSENPLSDHCRPWGGSYYNPKPTDPDTQWKMAVKDPAVVRSDDWDFPNGEPLSFAMIGRIHRGTPWQTIYLKSSDMGLTNYPVPLTNAIAWVQYYDSPQTARAASTWRKWTGYTNAMDAFHSRPVTDRLLLNLMDLVVNTNPPPQRLPVSVLDTNAWLAALDGLTAISNSPDAMVMTIASNSPQATVIAAGIQNARNKGPLPNQTFVDSGDVLSAPELAENSPFINSLGLRTRTAGGLSDSILEKIPSQLLALLRTDSRGSITRGAGTMTVQFSGYDGYPYAVETSPDLVNWTRVSTNSPVDGGFEMIVGPPVIAPRFYRSVLLQ